METPRSVFSSTASLASSYGDLRGVVVGAVANRRSLFLLLQRLFGGKSWLGLWLGMLRCSSLVSVLFGSVLAWNAVQISLLGWSWLRWFLLRRLSAIDRKRWFLLQNCRIAGFVWRLMHYLIDIHHRGRVTFSGDVDSAPPQPPTRPPLQPPTLRPTHDDSAIVIANHLSWADFYLVHAWAVHQHMLPYCKYFVKDQLKWLPSFGWGMYLMGMIFLRRSMATDKSRLSHAFAEIKETQLPIWLITYPEGHRYSTKFAQQSQEFAEARGLEPLRNVLQPRTKGFVAAVQSLRGSHVRWVYDLTLCYRAAASIQDVHMDGENLAPSVLRLFAGDLSQEYEFHVHVRRYALEQLPEEAHALSEWLRDRFREKDQILEDYYHGIDPPQ